MSNYIPTFGVEIHAQLKTKTKAFSNSKVDFSSEVNTNINNYDLAYPGTKPTVNKKMVEFGYRLAKILEMKIPNSISFDRKNYFYPDLAKGYQITQYFNPIGTEGKLTINLNGVEKDIKITEIHIEEDTAKQIKENGNTYFDYNRAGTPLIEIVSDHKDFNNVDEVIAYIKQMREQLIIMNINDGKLAEGSLRVDVNVSIRKNENDSYGTRTEIKNLNSFNNIRKALEAEINRQEKIIESDEQVISTTVRFDEESQLTIPMRNKELLDDYNFFPEYDILPIELNGKIKEEFDSIIDTKVSEIRKKLSSKYDENNISSLLDNNTLFNIYKELSLKYNEDKVFKIIVNNIKQIMNELKTDDFNIEILDKLISLREENKIDNTKLNDLIRLSIKKDITNEIDELNNQQMMTEEDLKELLNKILEDNKDKVEEFGDRLDRAEKFIMGQMMKETKGKANPQIIAKLLKREILIKRSILISISFAILFILLMRVSLNWWKLILIIITYETLLFLIIAGLNKMNNERSILKYTEKDIHNMNNFFPVKGSKIAIGLSGGVDSAVTAKILLDKGYDVEGFFMRNWDSTTNFELNNILTEDEICQQEEDYNDAKAVAKHLGIKLHRVDFVKEYWDDVFSVFLKEIEMGITPNPDILCNRHIKFDRFIDYIQKTRPEFDYVATGHYAKIIEIDNRKYLAMAKDSFKDQTYFLSEVLKERLNKIIFPLADLTKIEIRKIAEENKLPVAHKKDSTGICFIGKRNFPEFISNYLDEKPGKIVIKETGEVVGEHRGVLFYTIGQRKGLNLGGFSEPTFVSGKDVQNNILYISIGTNNDSLYMNSIVAKSFNYLIDEDLIEKEIKVIFKTRHSEVAYSGTFIKLNNGKVQINSDELIKAVTPGQELVVYFNGICIGGGQIETATKI